MAQAGAEDEARTLHLASQIAALPPLAVTRAKEVILAGQDASLAASVMLERKAFKVRFASHDKREGVPAFLEKRTPRLEGNFTSLCSRLNA